jgi:hypothetical protein
MVYLTAIMSRYVRDSDKVRVQMKGIFFLGSAFLDEQNVLLGGVVVFFMLGIFVDTHVHFGVQMAT